MRKYLNESVVIDSYLQQLEQNKINFLVGNAKTPLIKKGLLELRDASALNDKIEITTRLWKLLFETSMSSLDPR